MRFDLEINSISYTLGASSLSMTFVWCLKFADCSSRHYFLSYAVLRSARQRSIDTHNCVCTPTVLLAREQAHFPGDTFPMPLFPVLFSPCDTSHAGRFPQGPFTIESTFPTSLFLQAVITPGERGKTGLGKVSPGK